MTNKTAIIVHNTKIQYVVLEFFWIEILFIATTTWLVFSTSFDGNS